MSFDCVYSSFITIKELVDQTWTGSTLLGFICSHNNVPVDKYQLAHNQKQKINSKLMIVFFILIRTPQIKATKKTTREMNDAEAVKFKVSDVLTCTGWLKQMCWRYESLEMSLLFVFKYLSGCRCDW